MGRIMDRDVGDAKCCPKKIKLIPPPGPATTRNPDDHGVPPVENPPQVYNSKNQVRFLICINITSTHPMFLKISIEYIYIILKY